ncbi:hypothetical protein [Micromonospora humidisoli]|uniref:hypothetical protein n=1 Tax=Micromonospora sp. AKA109 TaxID=2733865 RepID=UPI00249230B9|nr:hypothetical protein [Micromonospora sp. AKA109]
MIGPEMVVSRMSLCRGLSRSQVIASGDGGGVHPAGRAVGEGHLAGDRVQQEVAGDAERLDRAGDDPRVGAPGQAHQVICPR